MYEIELKAHVEHYDDTKQTINNFAHFLGEVAKKDTYWKLKKKSIQVRVREEITNGKTEFLVTYKQKELRNTGDNNTVHFEVNQEREFHIDDRDSFEAILIDSGFEISLKKEKFVTQWKYENVLIELCTIAPLGNFLELEILSELNDSQTTKKSIEKLKSILLQANIPLEKIEHRYYSEMLRCPPRHL